jgi:hypothetical protein
VSSSSSHPTSPHLPSHRNTLPTPRIDHDPLTDQIQTLHPLSASPPGNPLFLPRPDESATQARAAEVASSCSLAAGREHASTAAAEWEVDRTDPVEEEVQGCCFGQRRTTWRWRMGLEETDRLRGEGHDTTTTDCGG